jgi:hypothetical protein
MAADPAVTWLKEQGAPVGEHGALRRGNGVPIL